MTRDEAVALLDRLHAAQNVFYGGGDDAQLRDLLTPDIVWTVPGDNAIAGTYRGIDEVLAYMRRRRSLTTFRMERIDVLVGDGDRVAALTDGVSDDARWSTVGLYELREGRIAACWLLPLDAAAFDAIWSR